MSQYHSHALGGMSDLADNGVYRVPPSTYGQDVAGHTALSLPFPPSFPISNSNFYSCPYTPTHGSPNFPPSLSAAISAATSHRDLSASISQQSLDDFDPSSLEEEAELPSIVVPNSFLERTYRRAQQQECSNSTLSLRHDSIAGDGHRTRIRVDSGVDLPVNMGTQYADLGSPACSPSLQYHLIRSYTDSRTNPNFTELFGSSSSSNTQVKASPNPTWRYDPPSSQLTNSITYDCTYCRPNVKSYSGICAHRSLSRHIEQTHSSSEAFPCSVPVCGK